LVALPRAARVVITGRFRPTTGATLVWSSGPRAVVALATDLLAWAQLLALDGPARRREPRKLRFRLLAAAGRLARGGRRLRLRIDATWPWAPDLTAAFTRLASLAPG
jgi:Transposase DDE domain group 1